MWIFKQSLSSSDLPFVSLWGTTTPNETIQLPISNLYKWSWGDGDTTTTETSHEYLLADDYEIKSSDEITDFKFNDIGDKDKLEEISNWGRLAIVSNGLHGCSNLLVTATDVPSLIETNIQDLFSENTLLTSVPSFNDWDFTAVTETSRLFRNDVNLNQVFILDMPMLINSFSMYLGCSLQNSTITINTTTALKDTNSMFVGMAAQEALITISNTSAVTNMNSMYNGMILYNQSISLDTSSNEDFAFFLSNARAYNQPDFFDTSSAKRMDFMYFNALAFDQDISDRDYSSVLDMFNFMTGKSAANFSTTNMDLLLNILVDPIFGLVFLNMTNVNISFGSINYTSAGAAAKASLDSQGFVLIIGNEV